MAILTTGKREASVMRPSFAGLGAMALHASHVLVEPGEREGGAEMVKALGGFPGVLGVTSEAFDPQLARVGILMAVRALAAHAQESLAEVFNFDFGAGSGGNPRRIMALLAGQLGVLSLESESGKDAVCERLAIQFGERKLPPVVFQVAAGAVDLSLGNIVGAGVVANTFFDAPANFSVTVQTLETVRAEAEVVTSGALGGAFE